MQTSIKKQSVVKLAGIKSIELDGVEDVYNMEVAGNRNFSICGGLIVHNCMDDIRYLCMTVMRNRGAESSDTFYGSKL